MSWVMVRKEDAGQKRRSGDYTPFAQAAIPAGCRFSGATAVPYGKRPTGRFCHRSIPSHRKHALLITSNPKEAAMLTWNDCVELSN